MASLTRRRSAPVRARRCLLPLLCVLAVPPPAAAQAPVYLEPGHWTWDAVRRLAAAGLAPPAADPAWAPLSLHHARAVFRHAAGEAGRMGRPGLQRLAEDWLALLPGDDPDPLAGAALRAGWVDDGGVALGGDGYFHGEDWEGARTIDPVRGPAVLADGYGWFGPRIGWRFDGGWLGDGGSVSAASLTAAAGPVDFWAGRRRLHYGAGRGGGTVLGGGTSAVIDLAHRTLATVDGVGAAVRDPFRLPLLGPMRIEVAAGRLPRSGNVDAPFVVFGRLSASPISPRFTIGLNRGAIFGGEGNPITLRRLAGLLVGEHGGARGEFENQVISVVVRYRPPLGPVPLEVYYERGADDTAGAMRDVPATIVGLDLAAVPGAPALALGLEYTRFAASCCGNPIWYRSVFFRGSWADEGRLFAHPVGGHGREWLAHARLDLPRAGVLLRTEAFLRHRGDENLYSPGRNGHSRGGRLALELRAATRAPVRLDASFEDGAGWSEHRISATVSHRFRRSSR